MKKRFNSSLTSLIAGVDEVGRGSLVGRIITSAVILNPQRLIYRLNDSKKLSEKWRFLLYKEITRYSLSWSIGYANEEEINRLNILQATLLAMQRAVAGLTIKPNVILVDGNKCPSFSVPSQAIIKGDIKIAEISAASIIAKVSRDREMLKLHLKFPEYGFAQHKGYPTRLHLKNLSLYGVTVYHRRSFSPIKLIL